MTMLCRNQLQLNIIESAGVQLVIFKELPIEIFSNFRKLAHLGYYLQPKVAKVCLFLWLGVKGYYSIKCLVEN